MKSLIIIFILTISSVAHARVYFAGSFGTLKQIDTSDSDGDSLDLLLEGTGYTAYLGYRFSFLALEGFYKSIETDSKSGANEFVLSDRMTGFGARVFLFKFINLKFGTIKHDASGDITQNGAKLVDYESTSSGPYSGIGIRVPFGMWDVFVDFTQYASEDDTRDDAGVLFHEYEFGLRYYI